MVPFKSLHCLFTHFVGALCGGVQTQTMLKGDVANEYWQEWPRFDDSDMKKLR